MELTGNPAALDVLQLEDASGKHFVGFGVVFFDLRLLFAAFNFPEQQAKIVGEAKKRQSETGCQNDDQADKETMPGLAPGLHKSVLHALHVTEHVRHGSSAAGDCGQKLISGGGAGAETVLLADAGNELIC